MSKKLYHGSCLCGKVKFEVNLDSELKSQKCNCTFCRKSHLWGIKVAPEDFKLLSGKSDLSQFAPNAEEGSFSNFFCSNCGLTTHRVHKPSSWAPACVFVNLTALDDMSLEESNSIGIYYLDGKANTWAPLDDAEEIKTL